MVCRRRRARKTEGGDGDHGDREPIPERHEVQIDAAEEKIEIEMGAAVVVEPDEGASRDASWGNMRPYVPAVEFFAEDEPPIRPGGPGPRTWEV